MRQEHALWNERGGAGGPLLVLLHGLGGNSALWQSLKPSLAMHWVGRWIAPDFAGHGRSPHRGPYSIERHAADVAALLEGENDVTVVGHSMGGLIAMAIASNRFGVRPKRVAAFSVKTRWSDEEIARAQSISRAPVRLFDRRADAVDRYMLVSGLKELLAPDSTAALSGVVEENGYFRLATDPLAYSLGIPEVGKIAAAVDAPLELLCGELDTITDCEQMRLLGRPVIALRGCGHNPHVEAPELLWREMMRGFAA